MPDAAPTLRDARADDLDALLAINRASEPGVGPIDAPGLRRLLAQAEACLLAADPATDAPRGFALILGPGLDYASPNYRWFAERHGARPHLYLDRVAVAEDARGQGRGATLYAALFERLAGRGPLGLEVNALPPNPGSLRFHRRLGFQEVGEQTFRPGEKAVVYLERPL